MDELGPPDFRSNKRFEAPVPVTITLPQPAWVYDVRSGKALGQQKKLQFTVTAYEPVILAVSPAPLPALRVAAPAEARRGSDVSLGFTADGTPAATHVVHIDVLDPKGERMLQYSGNLLAPDGRAAKTIPLALNDPAGQWTIRIHDLLSGQTETRTLTVN